MTTVHINGAGKVALNTTQLQTLTRQAVTLAKARVEVGILNTTSGRAPSSRTSLNNAEIGKEMEFGDPTQNRPARSWLFMPLFTFLGPTLQKLDLIGKLTTLGVKRTLGQIGVIAEDIVLEGFATGGFGLWASLRPWTIRRKGNARILIESGQLRKAVDSRVV